MANNLVDSIQLKQYNIFVLTNRIYIVGVINIDPEISDDEILHDIECNTQVIQAMITVDQKSMNKTLVDTRFDPIMYTRILFA